MAQSISLCTIFPQLLYTFTVSGENGELSVSSPTYLLSISSNFDLFFMFKFLCPIFFVPMNTIWILWVDYRTRLQKKLSNHGDCESTIGTRLQKLNLKLSSSPSGQSIKSRLLVWALKPNQFLLLIKCGAGSGHNSWSIYLVMMLVIMWSFLSKIG